jgi:Leucine-rich repeat (LRR) protein
LRSLDLESTPVSDVTPLAGLTALRSLALGGSHVRDLTPLPALALAAEPAAQPSPAAAAERRPRDARAQNATGPSNQ